MTATAIAEPTLDDIDGLASTERLRTNDARAAAHVARFADGETGARESSGAFDLVGAVVQGAGTAVSAVAVTEPRPLAGHARRVARSDPRTEHRC